MSTINGFIILISGSVFIRMCVRFIFLWAQQTVNPAILNEAHAQTHRSLLQSAGISRCLLYL